MNKQEHLEWLKNTTIRLHFLADIFTAEINFQTQSKCTHCSNCSQCTFCQKTIICSENLFNSTENIGVSSSVPLKDCLEITKDRNQNELDDFFTSSFDQNLLQLNDDSNPLFSGEINF